MLKNDRHGKGRPGAAIRRIVPFCAALLLGGAASGQVVTEYPTLTRSDLAGIAVAPDGNVWFVEQSEDKIARITPEGVVTEYPTGGTESFPTWITASPDGAMWFTENGGIARIDGTGAVHHFPGPATPSSRIAFGSDGNPWFGGRGAVYEVTTDGVFRTYPLPHTATVIQGMAADPDGNLWFTESNPPKIGRITVTGGLSEFDLPAESEPYTISAGPDGNLWFTEPFANRVGRVTTAGEITEFPLSGPFAFPADITAGPDGNLWFTEFFLGRIGQMALDGAATDYAIPTPGAVPLGIAADASGNVWFTEENKSKVGRLTPGPCALDAKTLCLGGGRFQLRAIWHKSDGTNGSGRAVQLTEDTGYFWFFNDANIEMMVKVLNACSFNPASQWVFAGGLTNVGVELTVTDTSTRATKTYTNPTGTAFQPIQDTSAFACP